jgi:large subunit ribosomal protein L30
MSGFLNVTLKKSMIGRPEKHRRILRAMGLTKINKTVCLQDIPSVQGMINKVSHLVVVKENVDET